MTDYVARILPSVVVHKLPNEGHFSYFFFCDECHRQTFLTIFGSPQGPLEESIEAPTEEDGEQEAANLDLAAEWAEKVSSSLTTDVYTTRMLRFSMSTKGQMYDRY